MSDPIFDPIPADGAHYLHDGEGWRWGYRGSHSAVTHGEATLLAEIVRLRQELAAARCECEHWWQEASR